LWIAAEVRGADMYPMSRAAQRRVSNRFVEGSAGVGALIGWRVAAGESTPRVACSHVGRASTQLADCVNRSLAATAVHWGVPIALGFIAAGIAAAGLVVALRGLRTRTI
jgi:hypothetical protein